MESTTAIKEAIAKGKLPEAVAAVKAAIEASVGVAEIMDSMMGAMEDVGLRFEQGKAFVPELLLAGRAMKGALELVKPLLAGTATALRGKVVIGTVKGDLHDIGKNLVSSMLEGSGFEIIDLGIDVSTDKFVAAIREHQPDILCMSALLTTTMSSMKSVIETVKEAGLRDKVKILVGGAPVSQSYADEIGADGYGDNANSAAGMAKKLVA
jgi:corrinoid protein of di/trimethylamine methyltransferase